MRVFFLVWGMVFLAGACTTLSESTCQEGNWRAIGLADGQVGRPSTYLAEHVKACSHFAITPDPGLWEQGRKQGLKTYCQPRTLYHMGRSGKDYSMVCPGPGEIQRQQAWSKGKRYHSITRQIRVLQIERDQLRYDAYHRRYPGRHPIGLHGGSLAQIRHVDRKIEALIIEREKFARL